ncbi:MAG: hypothetical protein WCI92_01895 [Bacteroidota bacterium]
MSKVLFTKKSIMLFVVFTFGVLELANAQSSVYVTGYENKKYRDVGVSVAKFWNNGNPVSLTDGKESAYGISITIENDDVYVAGATTNHDGVSIPTYWKNESPTVLNTNGISAFANCIIFRNSDVYVSIHTKDWKLPNVDYWKNDIPVSLKQEQAIINVNSLFVDKNNIVYATGNHNIGTGDGFINTRAAYWKGGKEILLSDAEHNSDATSIFVNETEIYIAGCESSQSKKGGYLEGYVATYWKNGKAIYLTDKKKYNFATSIYVSNGDVYVAGYGSEKETNNETAKYWKNGNEIQLTDGIGYSHANSIFVIGNDVYVAGEINPETADPDILKLAFSDTGANKIAVYWKNGKLIALTDKKNDASATSIFVK